MIRSALIACLALTLAAASAVALPVHVGVLGGVGFAKLSGPHSPVLEFGSLHAPTWGITVRVPTSAVLAVEPQVLFITDGVSFGKFDHTDAVGNATGTGELLHVLDRVQVPVLLRITPPFGLPGHPFAFAGPWVAVRLREYQRWTGDGALRLENRVLASSDFGATFGGGLGTRFGPGTAELQGRVDLGISDLGHYFSPGATRTNAVRVMVGWSY